ncbi:DUF3995 domain-containing protein [Saccharomonospora saliphila]|uniref:DUF3995 domain-containing protein n=1 Tax=Saccharomonospora saliphila TaxID=369829 RepID=UPI000362C1BF|nr:DUF3995 domain-containing protein [Saccharomonospora saliphila]
MNQSPSPARSAEHTETPSTRLRWLAGLCCAWMVVFAGVHVYWAAGGTFAMPAGFSIEDNTALLVIDIIAVPLCLAGAALALALVRPEGRRRPRTVTALTALTGLFSIVHAAGTIVADIGMLLGVVEVPDTEAERISAFVFEPWWLLGGVLFVLAAWTFHTDRRRVARG